MEHADRSPEPSVHALGALQQCLAALELTPAVRQTLSLALSQDVQQMQQRLGQMAQQAERLALLGEMAAKSAHEIRNHLYAIFLNADILEEEIRQPTSDSQAQIAASLSEIRTGVARLYDMAQDYLMLVHLPGLQRAPAALETVLQDTLLEVQERAATQGVTLCLENLVPLGCVSLHQGALRRALLSLMQRALQAMPQGGTLTLQGHRTPSQVVLEVRDTGSSIPDDQWSLLFEPFHSTTCTGLGLYLVREIVAAHGGTVAVRSIPGHGTTFTLTFPLVATALLNAQRAESNGQ